LARPPVGAARLRPPQRADVLPPPRRWIEFGERARDTVIRELREELGREVEVGALISVTENLFSFGGTPEHQIVFEFAASFAVGQEPPDLEPMSAHEDDGSPFEARWLPLDEVLDGTHIVYPEGFRGRLAAWLNR
jgi:ADP-ribose pyrophosphatase YjhB (NUDIX family)